MTRFQRLRVGLLLSLLQLLLGATLGIAGWIQLQETLAQRSVTADPFLIDREIGLAPNPDHPLNNAVGFRGQPFEEKKAAGVLRVFFIGDSSTYSLHGAGYVERLGAQGGGRCEFINAATTTLDILTIYIRYERDVLPLDPDVVVVAIPNAHFVQWRPSIGVDLLAFGLQRLKALAAAHGDRLYILAMPLTHSREVKLWTPRWSTPEGTGEDEYLADLYVAMDNSGIPVLDAARRLDWADALFLDQIHLRDKGYERLAEWLKVNWVAELCDN